MEDTGHSFLAYFKRATSPIAVLAILQEKPMYVYELASEMKKRSKGKFTISVLYPVIYRLEEQGFVEISESVISEGRARSYYRITQAGKTHLAKCTAEYHEICEVFEALLAKGDSDDEAH